jgi:DNA-3-methyladenine glycosylase II
MMPQRPGGAAGHPRRLTLATLGAGARDLAAVDPDLAAVLDRLGEPPLWGRNPGFPTLVRIILEQQVSLTAARTLYLRLVRSLGGMTPQAVHVAEVGGLRDFGLTRQKASYCHGLAARVLDGRLDLAAVARGPDDEGRRVLLEVPGLGPWSIDIYYLMALRRPDVWPQGDLALAAALRDVKRLDGPPTRDEQQAMAAAWVPWRSVAARILWAHYLDVRGQYRPRGLRRSQVRPETPHQHR